MAPKLERSLCINIYKNLNRTIKIICEFQNLKYQRQHPSLNDFNMQPLKIENIRFGIFI